MKFVNATLFFGGVSNLMLAIVVAVATEGPNTWASIHAFLGSITLAYWAYNTGRTKHAP